MTIFSWIFLKERIEDLLALSPEAILLRWVNHQLQSAGVTRRCTNFQQDVADSEIYSYLLKQIAPDDSGVSLDALRVRQHCINYHFNSTLKLFTMRISK